MSQHQSAPPERSAPAPRPAPARGPLTTLVAVAVGLVASTVLAWIFGVIVEIVGIYFFWPEEGERHSQAMVQEDLGYITEFPRSIIVPDTVAFAKQLAGYASWPFDAIGVPRFSEKQRATPLPENVHSTNRHI